MLKKIVIKGAKEHNLKNISLEIPKDKFVVITGLSGSGKSSLAFDTIYAEGQRRYVESLSAYARQFLDKMKKPNVDLIEGLTDNQLLLKNIFIDKIQFEFLKNQDFKIINSSLLNFLGGIDHNNSTVFKNLKINQFNFKFLDQKNYELIWSGIFSYIFRNKNS